MSTNDDDRDLRARLGRAFGIWRGGLDGPPPSVDELEAWAKDAARLREVDGLRRLRSAVTRCKGGGWLNAGSAFDTLLTAAAEVCGE
jgi:hypothetical protein